MVDRSDGVLGSREGDEQGDDSDRDQRAERAETDVKSRSWPVRIVGAALQRGHDVLLVCPRLAGHRFGPGPAGVAPLARAAYGTRGLTESREQAQ